MRNCEEMTAEVFRRIEAQYAVRKRKRRSIGKVVSVACCFCLAALIGIGVWRTASPPDQSNASTQTSAESVQTSGSLAEGPQKSIDAFYPARIAAGEFVIDMYRPEGYSQWIGSALALKMELSEEETERFHVIVEPWNRGLEEVIAEVNPLLAEPIDFSAFWTVNIVEVVDPAVSDPERVISPHNDPAYYGRLTAAQILALANSRYRICCSYVGSGEGRREDADWDTPEGIGIYCELLGDQMVFAGDHIECYPDVYAVDESYD